MRRISIVLFGWLWIANASPGLCQSPHLIEAAKKEGGKVVVYTSLESFTADALKKIFLQQQ